MEKMKFEKSRSYAHDQDLKDPLAFFRNKFHFPQRNGGDCIYFCGNSLGLQPKNAVDELNIELKSWKENGVEGHFSGERPWVKYHEYTKKSLARLVGAGSHEVVSMNNLTSNLHLLLASFYQPKGKRVKVMIEGGAFPSDHYAAESHMKRMGIDPGKQLITLEPKGGSVFTTEEIVSAINETGDELALVLFPGIQYYTGQFFNIKKIAAAAHEAGAYAGFDLAHAIGNLPMNLHEDDVDFATWCSYKYLNSGPGGVSGIFVHEKHSQDPDFPKLTGWWGHDGSTRFEMDNKFVPNPGVDAWMLSNMNILSSAVHLASLKVFDETSIEALRAKSIKLTGYLEYLMSSDPDLSSAITVITPSNPEERGCQLSVFLEQDGKEIFNGLTEAGVILDWREPNVIRVAPTPLYNSFLDVWNFYLILSKLLIN